MEKRNNNGRHQEFSFAAPTARSVQLVGDFTLWQEHPINLRRDKNGIWHTTVELKPGTHRYRFLVDGEWQDDPNCKKHAPNPYGSQDAICEVA
jgi:1,4-alpha-glucan branching enzyme